MSVTFDPKKVKGDIVVTLDNEENMIAPDLDDETGKAVVPRVFILFDSVDINDLIDHWNNNTELGALLLVGSLEPLVTMLGDGEWVDDEDRRKWAEWFTAAGTRLAKSINHD